MPMQMPILQENSPRPADRIASDLAAKEYTRNISRWRLIRPPGRISPPLGTSELQCLFPSVDAAEIITIVNARHGRRKWRRVRKSRVRTLRKSACWWLRRASSCGEGWADYCALLQIADGQLASAREATALVCLGPVWSLDTLVRKL